MKVSTQKSFRNLHTWTGLLTGLLLFIAFYAGAISVFVHELQQWHGVVQQRSAPVSLAQAQPLIDHVLELHPQAAHGFNLVLPGAHGPNLTLMWYDNASGTQYKFVAEDISPPLQQVARQDFISLIYDLHFTAGLPRQTGLYLFGIACILYGLALLSGIVIYAPVFVKDLFALRIGQGAKRQWLDLHNVIGVLSLPFHVIFAWSGAVLTIGFLMLAPFQFLVFDGELLEILEPDFEVVAHVEPSGVPADILPPAQLLTIAAEHQPAMQAEMLYYHDAGDTQGTVTIYGHLPSATLTQNAAVVLNAATGELAGTLSPEQFRPGTTFLRGLQNLHYGDFAGYASKWLYFVLGLAGALLFYSGNLLWLEVRRRNSGAQPAKVRVMASLTLGVCLGAVAGISALFIAGSVLAEAWHSKVYVSVFFAALLWAVIRRPAKAGVELLYACALLTLLIPFAAWYSSGASFLTALLQGTILRPAVEGTALLLAWLFWLLARATKRRARRQDNSICTNAA
ncbi:PepSY domain-containing protein [Rheinheimera sp.]|uniref:PepSY-associated TM helix domain-containing protein n=1 Tax=Rheinheimera sp. TaxID=1869214 RepID=UPI002732C378|nr:PepSY-associated TM helix domain-containing protein [Rheinheimera sp.]MDP2716975.1 PepSY-associated TM helix domain-containing protein [Rheinheimera sp.]